MSMSSFLELSQGSRSHKKQKWPARTDVPMRDCERPVPTKHFWFKDKRGLIVKYPGASGTLTTEASRFPSQKSGAQLRTPTKAIMVPDELLRLSTLDLFIILSFNRCSIKTRAGYELTRSLCSYAPPRSQTDEPPARRVVEAGICIFSVADDKLFG